jgi:hypothetical protein
MNIELALKVNKFIHEQCIDGVPHDIGWNVILLIENETKPKPTNSIIADRSLYKPDNTSAMNCVHYGKRIRKEDFI